MSLNIIDWFEVRVTSVKPRGEKHGPDRIKCAQDIDFVMRVEKKVLDEISVNCKFPVHHDAKGDVLRTGIAEIKLDRELKNYRLGISFNHIDPNKDSEEFLVERIKFKKATPCKGHLYDVNCQAQIHPVNDKDAGKITKQGVEIGMRSCFIKMYQNEQDLVDVAAAAKRADEFKKNNKVSANNKNTDKKPPKSAERPTLGVVN